MDSTPTRGRSSRSLQRPKLTSEDRSDHAVLMSRSVADLPVLQEAVLRSDSRVADLMLSLVRETTAARAHESRLLSVITDFAFRAFPNATHHVLVARDPMTGELLPLTACSRSGEEPEVALSRTIVNQVMTEGLALLYSRGQGALSAVDSLAISRMETAICAPLSGVDRPFGVVQLDIRRPGKGVFTREDMDLLSLFASQVGLALDNLRMHQQQGRALQSTINALVHSLNLKDPETAQHCERVQAVAMELGAEMGLTEPDLEILSAAALLHDLGKQGIRDELLFKPDRLTQEERDEMAQHAAHTQTILDMIEYPEHLKDVPRVAAFHHEKLDGTGPFHVAADEIPVQSRIISVADCFDALVSPRSYRAALTVKEALAILERGRGVDWDPLVVRALGSIVADLMATVYRDLPAAGGDSSDLSKAA